ncbi:hypothetical protein AAVH_10980 [Aphelenchoides avenae]|nr:hypothetical protein AAVH_10980 [Aphelenchus avenae]
MTPPRCTARYDPFPLWKNRTDKEDQKLKSPPTPSHESDQEYDPTSSEQQFSDWKDSWEAKMTKAIADGLDDADKLLNFMYEHRSPSSDLDVASCGSLRRNSLPEIGSCTHFEYITPRCDSAPPALEADGNLHTHTDVPGYLKFLNDQPEIIVKQERDDVYITVKNFQTKKSRPVRIRIE